jgi:hypothetical protein
LPARRAVVVDVLPNESESKVLRVDSQGASALFQKGDTLAEGDKIQRFGLNDTGQLALSAALADGRVLVVRAEPGGAGALCVTEPGAELLAGASALSLAGVRRRAVRKAHRSPRSA